MPAVNMRQAFLFMDNNSRDIIDVGLEAAAGYSPSAGSIDGSILEDIFMPGQKQQREFGQQVALTQMQQEWNSEGAKLKREIEAGVNPYLAAQGIAGAGGSSSPAASAPNSSIGSGSQALNALNAGVDSAVGAASASIQGVDTLSTLRERREKLRADTSAALEAAGLSKWEAKAIADMLPYRKQNMRADTWLKLGQFKNTVAEYRNIRKEYEVKKQTIDTLKKQAYNYEMQGDYANALKLRTDAETEILGVEKWWRDTEKQFWLDHGYKPDDEMDIALRNAAANGHDLDVEQVSQTIETFNYQSERGQRDADIDTAFDIAFNDAGGRAAVDADYAPYYAAIEANKQQLIEFFKMLYENPNDIKGLVGKFVNLISNFGSAIQIDDKGTALPKKPEHHRH